MWWVLGILVWAALVLVVLGLVHGGEDVERRERGRHRREDER